MSHFESKLFLLCHRIQDRHVSDLEQLAIDFRKKFGQGKGKIDHLTVYARFYSLFEHRLREALMLPPKSKSKVKNKEAAADQQDSLANIDPRTIMHVSKLFMAELTERVSHSR